MEKKHLEANEFAIKKGAKLTVDPTKLIVGKDGTLTMTFKIDDPKHLQVGEADIREDIGDCGVFVFDNKMTGSVGDLALTVTTEAIPKILLTASTVIDLTTDGQKGEHGVTLLSANEKKAY